MYNVHEGDQSENIAPSAKEALSARRDPCEEKVQCSSVGNILDRLSNLNQ
jgi:hypothetical protein